MSALSTDLRNLLAGVIKQARREAEAGARHALEFLAVAHHEPHGSMTPDERALRNRLRAHGRQLGDVRDRTSGRQSIERLVHEVAYEHWHRMLFARFLAENGLLIEPENRVSISREECEELARDAGEDPHAMAARFAQDALPQIFREGDPVLEVTLASNSRQALDRLLDSLPAKVFNADDSLGWTYQYWQADRKDAVNAAGDKIGADEISAVTQLFTEHYMVLFLYHNTIGAWWAGKVFSANPSLAETATSEQELRDAIRLSGCGGYDFEYLRFVRTEVEGDEEGAPTGPWRPAAGTYAEWPTDARDLTILDPCCGSGHFLTVGFELMVRLRMEEESLSIKNAIGAVLAENLHGLELDPRCTQIAPFNLAMAAWKMARGPIELPSMRIACSGLALGSTRDEWEAIAGGDSRLRMGMEQLYDLFRQAPTLGSLLDLRVVGNDMFGAQYDELAPLLDAALAKESAGTNAPDATERVVTAKGMAAAADLLSRPYTLCITNVPYLGRGQQDQILADYGEAIHPEAKNDLATMFVERMLRWVEPGGSIAAVTPQNWLFLTSYKKLREKLLTRRRWDFVARLGVGAFETVSGHVVNVALPIISASKAADGQIMGGIDVSDAKTAADKATLLRGELVEGLDHDPDDFAVKVVEQKGQLGNPDARVMTSRPSAHPLLGTRSRTLQGIGTADASYFITKYWECGDRGEVWDYYQMAPSDGDWYSGCHSFLRWERGLGLLATSPRARVCGQPAWGKSGLAIGVNAELPRSIFVGCKFDCTVAILIPNEPLETVAVTAFVRDTHFNSEVREVDQALSVTESSFAKLPFGRDHWKKIAAEKYPNGLPEPQSNDPTQWLFHGHPAGMLQAGDARDPNPAALLQVAVGRLLGYRWPPELDPDMRLDARAREWAAACHDLLPFADDDGIVCLASVKGESSAANRVRALLGAALGSEWSATREKAFLTAIAAANSTVKKTAKPASSLEDWLRDSFFTEHCKLFHHRPFIWHLWDGQKNGFHCLVNAHKLTGPDGEGRKTLEAITYAYLGDWIDRQKSSVAQGKEGADALLAAAMHLQGELKKILDGEPPYDLFVRWKPLHEQAIGWEPDINDGVRLNIRPFLTAQPMSGGKKGAGLLKAKPNVKWAKDRGKEPESIRPRRDFPWFWGCKGDSKRDADRLDWTADRATGRAFDGNRWNDLHYTSAVKQQARERHETMNDTEVEA